MSDLPSHSVPSNHLLDAALLSDYPSAVSPYGTYGTLDLCLNFFDGRDYCSCEYIPATHKNSRIVLVVLLPNLTIVQFWQHEPTWNHILHLQNGSISVFENSRQIRFSTEWRLLTHCSYTTHAPIWDEETQLACTAHARNGLLGWPQQPITGVWQCNSQFCKRCTWQQTCVCSRADCTWTHCTCTYT